MCWARLWAATHSSEPNSNSMQLVNPTSCCCGAFLPSKTFNRHGFFSFSAFRPVRPAIYGCLPEYSVQFANQHDVGVWQCFCSLLGQSLNAVTWEVGSLPLHMGGLGLRSACRTVHVAYWGTWADCLSTIQQRHANIADIMVEVSVSLPASAIHLCGAASNRAMLAATEFESKSWAELQGGLRPQQFAFDEMEPGVSTHRRQCFAEHVVEQRFRSQIVWPRCAPT